MPRTTRILAQWMTLLALMLTAGVACKPDTPYATQYKDKRQSQLGDSSDSDATTKSPDNKTDTTQDRSEREPEAKPEADGVSSEDETMPEGEESAMQESPVDPEQLARQQQAARLALGQQLYSDRSCVNCHAALAQSTKRMRSAAQILAAANVEAHADLMWPNQQEAAALEEALKN